MLLDLAKGISFLASLIALSRVAISAFFLPATRWQTRLWRMLPDMAIAICLCLVAGMVFRWPAKSNTEGGQRLATSLPVRMMLWAIPAVAILFAVAWYLACGNPLQSSRFCG